MKTIKVISKRYEIVQFENGCYGAIDNEIKGFKVIEAGYKDLAVLTKWIERLSLRHVWGI